MGVTLEFSRGRGSLDAGPRCICTLLQAVEAQSRMTGWCESCRAATRQLAKGPGESRMSSSFFNIVSPGPPFWWSEREFPLISHPNRASFSNEVRGPVESGF